MNISATAGMKGETDIDCGGRALRGLVEPFAARIFAAAEVHRALGALLPPAYATRLMDSTSDDIRGATCVHSHGVSKAAATEAHRRGIDRLGAKTWKDQPEFDPNGQFSVELLAPVRHLLYACMSQLTREAVENVLMWRLAPVWLLRREHDVLANIGARERLMAAGSRADIGDCAHREALFRHAGIVLLS
jgi:hypothetical protein